MVWKVDSDMVVGLKNLMVCLIEKDVNCVITFGVVSCLLNELFSIVKIRESFESFEFKREFMTKTDDVTHSNSDPPFGIF